MGERTIYAIEMVLLKIKARTDPFGATIPGTKSVTEELRNTYIGDFGHGENDAGAKFDAVSRCATQQQRQKKASRA